MLSRFYTYENEDQINTDLKCSICLDPYQSPLCDTYCGHMFCFKCIKQWLIRKQSCPICRRYFTKFAPVTDEKLLRELDDLSVQCMQCSEMNIKRSNFNDHIRYRCTKRIFIDQEENKESLEEQQLNVEYLLRVNKPIENDNRRREQQQQQQNYEETTCNTSLMWLLIIIFVHISFHLLSFVCDVIFLLIIDTIICPILYTISRLIRFIITTINFYK